MRHLQQLIYIDAVARTGSIRRAAQSLAITSTALNRRILSVEDDLGTPIFERTGKGVRLSTAGEIFIHHVRQQLSDMEKIKSQIADLQGERRGVVSIACGQSLMQNFLPQMVSLYRADHPYVDFKVSVCGRDEAADRLLDFSVDLAIVFDPDISAEMQVLQKVPQANYAVMSCEHPLAKKAELSFNDCIGYPLALPSRRSGLRALLEKTAAQQEARLWVALESDCQEFLLKGLRDHAMLSFQISVASDESVLPDGVVAVKIGSRELAEGTLVVLQQKGRTLPVAAAKFLNQLTTGLSAGESVIPRPVRKEKTADAPNA